MNTKEHQQYLKDLKALTESLLKSKQKSQDFYISVGIHTKSGNLSSRYSSSAKIGFRTSKDSK